MRAFMLRPSVFRLDKNNRFEYLFLAFCLIVYAGTFFFPLMDKDAARHANVALHMYQTGDYLRLVERGSPYLDKPHFLFWSILASYNLFGINTFAARFPHFLFALIAIYSVYKAARHLSGETTAKLAALMLATMQAFVLAIMDARMETPLTAGIAFALWHGIVYVDKRLFQNLILAALGVAVAFSTKGWIGPIIIFTTVLFYILLQKKWTVLAKPETYLFIPLFVLFIAPVLYAYYVQFDLHPELVVRGRSGHSGVAFILWNQNTERFAGDAFAEGKGGRNSGYFFLYHTFLWAAFPWSILAYAGIVFWMKRLFSKKKWRHPFGAFALSFLLLLFLISFSDFKMPHYIIMLFPLAALATAPYLRLLLSYPGGLRIFLPLHIGFALLLIPLLLALNFYFFKPVNIAMWILGPALLIGLLGMAVKGWDAKGRKLVYVTATLSLVLNFFLNYNFFPNLMKYQAGNELVKELKKKRIAVADKNIRLLESNAHTFDFYRAYNHPVVHIDSVLKNGAAPDTYFILNALQKTQLTSQGFAVQPVASHVDYNVSTVTFKFLNPKTRPQKLDTLLLARLYKP
jgi:4-amino-4-deoxy-L-arabinose transferase-like glycosyltransferase